MNIKEIQNKIDDIEKKINDYEIKKATLEGKQQVILEKLEKEYNIKSLIDIDSYINENKNKLEKLEKDINEKLEIIKEYFK